MKNNKNEDKGTSIPQVTDIFYTMFKSLGSTIKYSKDSFVELYEMSDSERAIVEKFCVYCLNNFKIFNDSIGILSDIQSLTESVYNQKILEMTKKDILQSNN